MKKKQNAKSDDDEEVEKIYQKKTQHEHILLRPDTYIGTCEKISEKLWVYQNDRDKLELREISYVPGLYKIFDEILVNAVDNIQRDPSMNVIKVKIDQQNNLISIYNNGKGIPVVVHKIHQIYVPELIFGHLLTSSNYDDSMKKITGGRNGFGAKLTNIFSTKFTIETADSVNKKRYTQVFSNNLRTKSEPEIKSFVGEDYTKITFEPDLSKFQMKELEDDIVSLMHKRVLDVAGTTPLKVHVYLNERKLPIKTFEDYIDLYLKANLFDDKIEYPKIAASPSDRWNVAISLADSQFQQVSFVNGICTTKGGTHVNYIIDQVVEKISEHIKKKFKDIKLKTPQIKSNLWVFINCYIENPTFDSQTKESMTLKAENFGSTFVFTEKFFKELLKSPIVTNIIELAKAKEKIKLHKALSSNIKKSSRLLGIEKLEDANLAGSKNFQQCTLIVTEGDSAKALALAGIEVVGRDYFGVFPLKGKFLNVRNAKDKTIIDNEEIQNLIKILGLKMGQDYSEGLKGLRYGSLMVMADQDYDGSHIKGLIINFIHFFWPSLLKRNGFLREFITPIVKATKDSQVRCFYTIKEYNEWYSTNSHSGWKIKYYKGLGTSTNAEAKEYFTNIKKHKIEFKYIDKEDDSAIELGFMKNDSEQRKDWLSKFDPLNTFIDHSRGEIRYKDFINKELIFFSNYDNTRSIPSVVDGLKPSERKVLYSCFKRNLRSDLKVAQLAGYVAEHSSYHHGEVSLCSTIISLAQDFVGANNLNLLVPIGQFGSRYTGSKGAASARYIYTCLSKLTRVVFREEDDQLLLYNVDEGMKIEPVYYLPIIPMVLVNGAEGIGTGWSTSIPQYNPIELAENIILKLNDLPYPEVKPWYRGFKGDITEGSMKNNSKSYNICGKISIAEDNENSIEITELPIHEWTRDYKANLEKNHMDNKDHKDKDFEIEDIKEYHTENQINFIIRLTEESFKKVSVMSYEERLKLFRLTTSVGTSNMVLFDADNKIKKYQSINEIIDEFSTIRLRYYENRKDYLLNKLKYSYERNSMKIQFIRMVLDGIIPFKTVKNKQEIFLILKSKGILSNSELKAKYKNAFHLNSTEIVISNDAGEENEISDKGCDYEYLMNMNIWSLTPGKIADLENLMKKDQNEIDYLEQNNAKSLWKADLQNFIAEYKLSLESYDEKNTSSKPMKFRKVEKKNNLPKKNPTSGNGSKKKKKELDDFLVDDDDEEESDYSEYSDVDSDSEDSSEENSYESEHEIKQKATIRKEKEKQKSVVNSQRLKKKNIIREDKKSSDSSEQKRQASPPKILTTKSSIAIKDEPKRNSQAAILKKTLNSDDQSQMKVTDGYKMGDLSKLTLKERLALRIKQGNIDDYFNVVQSCLSSSSILKEDPYKKNINTDDILNNLLGNKQKSTNDISRELDDEIEYTPMKEEEKSSSLTQSRSKKASSQTTSSNKKIIILEDDDDE